MLNELQYLYKIIYECLFFIVINNLYIMFSEPSSNAVQLPPPIEKLRIFLQTSFNDGDSPRSRG